MAENRCSFKDLAANLFSHVFPGTSLTASAAGRWPELQTFLQAYHLEETPPPEILMFGDSVSLRVAHEDQDRSTLGEMVARSLAPDFTICKISHSAYTPRIFYPFLKLLEVSRRRPQLVILPINLRCFSPQWDLHPSWQFRWEIKTLRKFCADLTRPVPRQPQFSQTRLAQGRFNFKKVSYPGIDFTRIRQFLKVILQKPESEEDRAQRWRVIFIYHYGYPLLLGHRTMQSLIKSRELMKLLGIKLLAYITPINFQAGIRYAGDIFARTVEGNLGLIERLFQAPNDSTSALTDSRDPSFRLTNWATCLTPNYFFHDRDPTEHLNESGRLKLAKKINDQVRQMVDLSRGSGGCSS